ncbi:acetylornithine deacetylase [Pantoea sp. GM01]|uniref:acetylornithine deacetylase n=1 Tax=Pantoea sp. GM01 TaxID=1144320 RepID=UPI000270F0A7|nr:acetylornithine deacetylase [Pantoea sp. GM01]EJL93184.1 acetylornithine deacetylase ArgE [Pantoea sp. GM01]
MINAARDILATLLAFDTTSRESNLALIGWIENFLDQRGVSTVRITNAEGTKANLYARIGPEGDGGVMLSGHTDVVPVDGQDWQVPPFALTERDGRFYGRGCADMKGFLACVLASLDNFLAMPLRMPLHLAFSYDEEVGCLGVRSMIELLQASSEKPALCIIGEPTEMQPVYGHKGKVAMRCQIHGRACHSAYAPDGVNAIEFAAKMINHLNESRAHLALQKDTRFDPPFSTLQIGVIQGGSALNIVPQYCQFDFEIRHLPDINIDGVLDEAQRYAQQHLLPSMRGVAEESAIHFTPLSRYPGLLTDPQSQFAQWLSQWSGCNQFSTVAFGTEGGLFDEAGIATMICGPGSMEQGHKPDEFVAVEQIDKCIQMLSKLAEWMLIK